VALKRRLLKTAGIGGDADDHLGAETGLTASSQFRETLSLALCSGIESNFAPLTNE
jgi:hypothetical protein